MVERIRQLVLAVLKVPPEPELPEGSAESMLIFRAGRNFYRWQVLMWCLSHVSVVGLILAYTAIWVPVLRGPQWLQLVWGAAGILGLALIALVSCFAFLALRWNFELRWYILTDRSLRIRRGVWNVEELTMTFANVQEVRVTAGPIQNALGIADVEVHSAGGGTVKHSHSHGEESGHAAIFEGVDNANEIRDRIVERLRVYRDSGLGGDHSEHEPANTSGETLAAVRDVLSAAKSLREILQQP